ncbi:hypothetical protein BDZ85DRAFT_260466 [Elsinoe ampelina]|uniref:DNA replication factor Cdt1 C-terminal domain-containing protein n=1 Tax=Elsinoe ampelina TaxID=302913 RepID=A0A6A6GEM0_9PEZI|nr:hypothetical protein BDZ85DRAFT_260466 [Elsinoe ampelina]
MAAATMSRKRKAVEDVSELQDGVKGRTAKSRRTAEAEQTKPKKILQNASRRIAKLAQDQGKEQQTEPSLAPSKTVNKRQRSPEPAETPRHKRVKDTVPPTPEETPTRGASRLFDRLNLLNTAAITSSSENLQAYQSPPETPHSHALKGVTDTLPTKVEDLKQQFTALLSSHALFVAHYGAGSPCALPELASRVTQTWKKRAVSIDDIRRLVAILAEASPFLLIDNGEGMICLEIKEGREGTSLQNKQLIDEFSRRLQRRWLRWSATADNSIDAFLTSLPLALIVKSEVAKDPNKQSKGAYHLAQLKARPAEVTAASAKKVETVKDEAKTSAGVSSRGASLLDRILAKQAAIAAGPGGPAKEQLDRLAALDKVEDVTRILDFLAGGRPRASFSMQAVVQHLQNSMRSPIGREEAERVIEVMAQEICPRFVQTVKTGGLYGVVVTKMGRPLDLKTRLDAARSKSS